MTEVLESNIRDNAVSKFSKCFNDTKKGKELAIKIEKSTYDWVSEKFKENGNDDDFENPQFKYTYVMKLGQLYYNINDNKELKTEIQKKNFNTDELPKRTPIQLNPDKWQEEIIKKNKLDEINYTAAEQVVTDQFLCTRCQSRKCTYYQRQMRSADEPATYFVTCLNCNNSWRF